MATPAQHLSSPSSSHEWLLFQRLETQGFPSVCKPQENPPKEARGFTADPECVWTRVWHRLAVSGLVWFGLNVFVSRFSMGCSGLTLFGMAWFGMSWFSVTWLGKAWFSMSWFYMAWFSMSSFILTWFGMSQFCVAWFGMSRFCVAWFGNSLGLAWDCSVWPGTARRSPPGSEPHKPLLPRPQNPLQTQARLPISKGLFGNPSRALRPGIPPRCPSLSSRGRPLNHSARQGKQTPVCPLIRRGKTSGGGGGALGQHGSQTDPRLIHLNPSPSITPAESACLTPTTLAFLTGTGLRIVCHS